MRTFSSRDVVKHLDEDVRDGDASRMHDEEKTKSPDAAKFDGRTRAARGQPDKLVRARAVDGQRRHVRRQDLNRSHGGPNESRAERRVHGQLLVGEREENVVEDNREPRRLACKDHRVDERFGRERNAGEPHVVGERHGGRAEEEHGSHAAQKNERPADPDVPDDPIALKQVPPLDMEPDEERVKDHKGHDKGHDERDVDRHDPNVKASLPRDFQVVGDEEYLFLWLRQHGQRRHVAFKAVHFPSPSHPVVELNPAVERPQVTGGDQRLHEEHASWDFLNDVVWDRGPIGCRGIVDDRRIRWVGSGTECCPVDVAGRSVGDDRGKLHKRNVQRGQSRPWRRKHGCESRRLVPLGNERQGRHQRCQTQVH
ncbi:hypothetical protein H310_09936 [Aphanomyces invadans]|uniref:Uncharacterized protein n=1 Tax=Aphanomyces invadans TaxID=157072 RepID=A0A024TU21_9STRA|nr:hypothetical protein H310_09936 [Aphanomyces invadans]ETV97131.1 hypothetical protein H310_09936 [Aphanomyces invadans]|eukprot:XP_008874377.1 hypothetical protein H310_09936 [Aphanomyces invadans]